MEKNPPATAGDARGIEFDPWAGKILWRRKWQLTQVFLPGKFCGQRSLAGYSPWGFKDLDMTELSRHTRRQEGRGGKGRSAMGGVGHVQQS